MILLNFTSAAKYILTLMLAILGIIPYELVEVPRHSSTVDRIEQLAPERELATMSALELAGESICLKSETGQPQFIRSRSEHSRNCTDRVVSVDVEQLRYIVVEETQTQDLYKVVVRKSAQSENEVPPTFMVFCSDL